MLSFASQHVTSEEMAKAKSSFSMGSVWCSLKFCCSYGQPEHALLLLGHLWSSGEDKQRQGLIWFLQCLVSVWFNFSDVPFQTFSINHWVSISISATYLWFFPSHFPRSSALLLLSGSGYFVHQYINIYRQHSELPGLIHATSMDQTSPSPGLIPSQWPLLQLGSRDLSLQLVWESNCSHFQPNSDWLWVFSTLIDNINPKVPGLGK